jgi:hypothetical protein
MGNPHEHLLKKYLQLPDRLEAAIAGLDETGLGWKGKEGWSIRAYVHHTVEGELIWQVNLRAAAGCDGIAFPMGWYFLRCLPEAWDRSGHITWPGDQHETILSVRDIFLMHIRHMDQHSADIRAIRELHQL